MSFQVKQYSSILDIDATAWNTLAADSPFLRHEFLGALERTGCVGEDTTWKPAHLTVTGADGNLAGALPLYIKYDSQGEFVFDWSWANAYDQGGLSYYPKLVSAVPFTPATGQRLLIKESGEFAIIAAELLSAARNLSTKLNASSLHVLFPNDTDRRFLSNKGLLQRKSCQFHWHNDNYKNFEEFLARFVSAKRKKARRERRRIIEAGVRFEHLSGNQPNEEDWDTLFKYYARTFLRRGRSPYLNREFFREIARTMPENIVLILARFNDKLIATAICFRSEDTLYGRYWGSLADFHSLHFEACYYQGIEYCINQGLSRFEPGTQGEHKLSRGFTPTATWSNHWILDPEFRQAVAQFLDREKMHVDTYMNELTDHVPYRKNQVMPLSPAHDPL
ncbi:MAG: GNAT family N-acetyltransferase [Pseudomonadota bacterium]|jgi:hypothetical protein|nr:GNAT family N-acetyltransferase [Pseudomonadota bacterium]